MTYNFNCMGKSEINKAIEKIMAQIAEKKRKNDEIDRKIERLKKAYKCVQEQYGTCRNTMRVERKQLEDTRKWKGNCFNEYKVKSATLFSLENDYYNEINKRIMDEINNQINYLRKQKYSDSVFGDLRKQVSNAETALKNLLN